MKVYAAVTSLYLGSVLEWGIMNFPCQKYYCSMREVLIKTNMECGKSLVLTRSELTFKLLFNCPVAFSSLLGIGMETLLHTTILNTLVVGRRLLENSARFICFLPFGKLVNPDRRPLIWDQRALEVTSALAAAVRAMAEKHPRVVILCQGLGCLYFLGSMFLSSDVVVYG